MFYNNLSLPWAPLFGGRGGRLNHLALARVKSIVTLGSKWVLERVSRMERRDVKPFHYREGPHNTE